jgi:hypothetical protein
VARATDPVTVHRCPAGWSQPLRFPSRRLRLGRSRRPGPVPDIPGSPRQRQGSSAGNPCAMSSSVPAGRFPQPPTSAAPGRPTVAAPPRSRALPCHQSCPARVRHRPEVGLRASQFPPAWAPLPPPGSRQVPRSRSCGSSPRTPRIDNQRIAHLGIGGASAASARTSDGRTNSPVSLANPRAAATPSAAKGSARSSRTLLRASGHSRTR